MCGRWRAWPQSWAWLALPGGGWLPYVSALDVIFVRLVSPGLMRRRPCSGKVMGGPTSLARLQPRWVLRWGEAASPVSDVNHLVQRTYHSIARPPSQRRTSKQRTKQVHILVARVWARAPLSGCRLRLPPHSARGGANQAAHPCNDPERSWQDHCRAVIEHQSRSEYSIPVHAQASRVGRRYAFWRTSTPYLSRVFKRTLCVMM